MSAAPQAEPVQSCAQCGASIYPEHITQGLVKQVEGKYICNYCLAEPVATEALAGAGDGESLTLVDETPPGEGTEKSAVHGFSGTGVAQNQVKLGHKRSLNPEGQGATRIRIFHSKLSEGATRNMEEQVNSWLDDNPDVSIKFAETTVGVWEGKHSEPNLILTLFY